MSYSQVVVIIVEMTVPASCVVRRDGLEARVGSVSSVT